MPTTGAGINQGFASIVWAERILFYLSSAQAPPDKPSIEQYKNEEHEEEEAQSFLDVDTLENDILSQDTDGKLENKFLDSLAEIFSHTMG